VRVSLARLLVTSTFRIEDPLPTIGFSDRAALAETAHCLAKRGDALGSAGRRRDARSDLDRHSRQTTTAKRQWTCAAIAPRRAAQIDPLPHSQVPAALSALRLAPASPDGGASHIRSIWGEFVPHFSAAKSMTCM
jgi:hypothetical protein